MVANDTLRLTKIALNNGSGAIPAMGFGTLIPDPVATRTATKAALEAGFRQLDASERYRNEKEVGEALQEVFQAGKIKREDVFIATKLWNNNHRPERIKPAFEASLKRLQLDYANLYLIHTPFAFQPGDDQDPRDANGNVIYDKGVTLLDTWRALEGLVDEGRCKAIGLSDVSLEEVKEIFEAARIKPAVVHVESHPYLPEWELLDYCKKNGIVLQAFAALGHGMQPSLMENPVITAIAKRVNKTPVQVLLAWAIQRGTALLTTSTNPSQIKENFDVSDPSRRRHAGDQRRNHSRGSGSMQSSRPAFPGLFQENRAVDRVILMTTNATSVERHPDRFGIPFSPRSTLLRLAGILALTAVLFPFRNVPLQPQEPAVTGRV